MTLLVSMECVAMHIAFLRPLILDGFPLHLLQTLPSLDRLRDF